MWQEKHIYCGIQRTPRALSFLMIRPGLKVLIVDDSAVVRRNLKKLLSRLASGVTVLEANGVRSSVQQVEVEHPDAVIVDIQLPDGSGFDVLEYLALQSPPPFTVVLTNYPDQRNRERATALGARFFFDKSFEYEKLLDALSEI